MAEIRGGKKGTLQKGRDTEEGGILRRKTDKENENRGKKGMRCRAYERWKDPRKRPSGSIQVALPSSVHKEYGNKATRWIGASLEGNFYRNVSGVKQEPSLCIKGFYYIREFMPHLLSRAQPSA